MKSYPSSESCETPGPVRTIRPGGNELRLTGAMLVLGLSSLWRRKVQYSQAPWECEAPASVVLMSPLVLVRVQHGEMILSGRGKVERKNENHSGSYSILVESLSVEVKVPRPLPKAQASQAFGFAAHRNQWSRTSELFPPALSTRALGVSGDHHCTDSSLRNQYMLYPK